MIRYNAPGESAMTTVTQSVFLRFSLVVLMLQTCAANLSAARYASGRFSPHCDGASFYLSNVDGLSGEEEVRLNLRQSFDWSMYRSEEVWAEVYAARCPHIGNCESATHARIWLEKTTPKDKHVSGK